MKPATAKARALLAKLEAYAARGFEGEKINAQRKVDKMRRLYDFAAPVVLPKDDLFAGVFQRGTVAEVVATIPEHDIAAAAKWAIESATGIPCLFRGADLMAEAKPATAARLSVIAGTVAGSFRALWAQFVKVPGVNGAERGLFVRGLFDGMMGDARADGERLPARAVVKGRKGKGGTGAILAVHPYAVALGLGKGVRFSVPLPELAAELDRVVAGSLGGGKVGSL